MKHYYIIMCDVFFEDLFFLYGSSDFILFLFCFNRCNIIDVICVFMVFSGWLFFDGNKIEFFLIFLVLDFSILTFSGINICENIMKFFLHIFCQFKKLPYICTRNRESKIA